MRIGDGLLIDHSYLQYSWTTNTVLFWRVEEAMYHQEFLVDLHL